jgi:flagellar basal-body rod modification protein FlgD
MTLDPMSSLNSTAALGATAPSGSSTGSDSSNPLLKMSSGDTFLQLLVAQLKYQDPMNPADPTQFMSQTAQMSEAANMSALMDSEKSLLSDMGTMASTSMIGKQVTANLPNGTPVTGVVSSVGIESTGPVLHVGSSSVPLSAVTAVTAPSATSAATPATGSASSTDPAPSST